MRSGKITNYHKPTFGILVNLIYFKNVYQFLIKLRYFVRHDLIVYSIINFISFKDIAWYYFKYAGIEQWWHFVLQDWIQDSRFYLQFITKKPQSRLLTYLIGLINIIYNIWIENTRSYQFNLRKICFLIGQLC